MELQDIILLSMPLQEVIMPTTLLPGTMLPMVHMVLVDMVATLHPMVLTMHPMVPTVEARTQPLQSQHMELQQQLTTKREFAQMSGDFTSFYPLFIFFLSYVKPVDYIPGEVCCSTKVKPERVIFLILHQSHCLIQVIEPKCTETTKTVKRYVTETVSLKNLSFYRFT